MNDRLPSDRPPLPRLQVLGAAEVTGPRDFFRCSTLGACLFAKACIARQEEGDRVGRVNANRGLVAEFPTCLSSNCQEGRTIRTRITGAKSWIRKPARPWVSRWMMRSRRRK